MASCKNDFLCTLGTYLYTLYQGVPSPDTHPQVTSKSYQRHSSDFRTIVKSPKVLLIISKVQSIKSWDHLCEITQLSWQYRRVKVSADLAKIKPSYSRLLMSLQDNLFGVMEVFNLQACDTGILLVGW